ncbi:MAG: hypothetical protein AB2765_14800 [Candidatus Thiodiazotropha endolucinida]
MSVIHKWLYWIGLFFAFAWMCLFSTILFAAETEEYYSGHIVFVSSDHWIEGEVDTHFDQELHRLGRSTSEELFPDKQPMRRVGAIISKVYKKDNSFFEWGVFVDPNGKIVGKSELGVIHVRRDSIAVFALVGAEYGRFSGGAGAYGMGSQADVYSYVARDGDVFSFSDKINEASAGLVLKASFKVTDKSQISCYGFGKVDSVNSLGTDNVVGCGYGYRFR